MEFTRQHGPRGNECDGDDAYQRTPPVYRTYIIYIGNPLFDEITWYLVHRQPQQIFYLRREDGDGNTACKSHHDGVGNVLDDGSQT